MKKKYKNIALYRNKFCIFVVNKKTIEIMSAAGQVKKQIENGNLTLRTLKEVKKGVFTSLRFTDYTLLWGEKAVEKLTEEVREELRSNNYVLLIKKKGGWIYMTIEEFNAKYNNK